MNIENYRSSFTVLVTGSDIRTCNMISESLNLAGYNCELKLSFEALIDEIKSSPPHIMIFFYDDVYFKSSKQSYSELLERVNYVLPEVHIIFLANNNSLVAACELYENGIYDCLPWPGDHPRQLLRAVDRAAENDYYMYLNEQMRESVSLKSPQGEIDFSLYEVWLKEIMRAQSREQLIDLWLREGLRILGADEGLFMRYLDSKQTLVATHAIGIEKKFLSGVGLDLAAVEPGFESKMLFHPNQIRALHDFTINGLMRQQAAFYPLIHKNQILGVFILVAKKNESFSSEQLDNAYLRNCLIAVQMQLTNIELNSKLFRFSVYDETTGVLNSEMTHKKIKEEISRSRRISKPVALLLISIDRLADLNLSQTKTAIDKLLKSLADVFSQSSRLNDLVGRVNQDQFAICLPHTSKHGALIKAERLRVMLASADYSNFLGRQDEVSISVGISEYPSSCHDEQGLFGSAEKALLEVKKRGGNSVQLATVNANFVPDFIVEEGLDASTVRR